MNAKTTYFGRNRNDARGTLGFASIGLRGWGSLPCIGGGFSLHRRTDHRSDSIGELAHVVHGWISIRGGLDRIVDDQRDVSWLRGELALLHHVPAADDGNRYDRQAGLHRQHDAAAFEFPEVAVAAARAFGED